MEPLRAVSNVQGSLRVNERQAGGHNVPELAHRRLGRVEFRADQRGEIVGAEASRRH